MKSETILDFLLVKVHLDSYEERTISGDKSLSASICGSWWLFTCVALQVLRRYQGCYLAQCIKLWHQLQKTFISLFPSFEPIKSQSTKINLKKKKIREQLSGFYSSEYLITVLSFIIKNKIPDPSCVKTHSFENWSNMPWVWWRDAFVVFWWRWRGHKALLHIHDACKCAWWWITEARLQLFLHCTEQTDKEVCVDEE